MKSSLVSGSRSRPALAALLLLTGCTAPPPPVPTSPPTAAATSSAPTSVAVPALSGAAAEALARLPVAPWATGVAYSRDAFGDRWTDDIDVGGGHNGCDQRSDILRRDLDDVVLKRNTQGCVPATGTLHDPYTGATISFVRGADTSADVQIDHVVALSNAWRTGAQRLTAQQRQDFAGDPLGLLAVDGASNQSKGDDDAAAWLPPRSAFRCAYVARQIAVKTTYRLWVTPDEAASMAATLADCPGEPLPADVDVPAPVR